MPYRPSGDDSGLNPSPTECHCSGSCAGKLSSMLILTSRATPVFHPEDKRFKRGCASIDRGLSNRGFESRFVVFFPGPKARQCRMCPVQIASLLTRTVPARPKPLRQSPVTFIF
jgi:hypothetical protein